MEEYPTLNDFDRFMGDVMNTLYVVPRVMDAYMETLESCKNLKTSEIRAIEERKILVEMVKDSRNDVSAMHNQMKIVRKLLDEEKNRRKRAEHERDYYMSKLEQMGAMFNNDLKFYMSSEKLSHSNKYFSGTDEFGDRLNNAVDLQTTDTIMADLSYTRDENDLDFLCHESRSHRQTSNDVNKKKRRSSSAIRFCELSSKDNIRAKAVLKVEGKSDINASAFLENKNIESTSRFTAKPMESALKTSATPELNNQFLNVNVISSHSHNFQQKSMLKGGMCSVCFKRLRFSSIAYKCRDCKTICHVICKDNAPLPCLFNGRTPHKVCNGGISDFTPMFSPMVPALVVHCIKEIENRGLTREGLYLIPGADVDVKSLKSKLLRGKVPDLSQIQEIDVVCGCLKDFFESLKDQLITRARWKDFASAVEIKDIKKLKKTLYQIISELPQPNRETLAYLVLHLKKIVESPDCKMTVSLLANVFGPTIIGYSCDEPDNFYRETRIANKVMVELLELHKHYWEGFIYQTEFRVPCSPVHEFVLPMANVRNIFDTPGKR